MENIPVEKQVTASNDELADSLRKLFAESGVLVLNVIASPGAGKTSLLEQTIERLGSELVIRVIEGDPFTRLDSERIEAAGATSAQINTQGGCHLEARMVQEAVDQLDLGGVDIVIIENVGNLLCPTGWDLGEDIKVVVASLPEGDDKPLKFPAAFLVAQAAVLNKIDLEPHLPAQVSVLKANALQINPDLEVFATSCTSGEGLAEWCNWIKLSLADKREGRK